MSRTTDELRALDKQHLWHPFTHMKPWLEGAPLVITAAEGMHLVDSDGNRYLDGVASLWCNVHGHRVPEIDAAVRAQLDKVAHTTMLGLASEAAILLAERLTKVVPPGLNKVFYSDAGATATEIAFKLAAQYWYNRGRAEKNKFVAFGGAYHGDTVGAMSVGRVEDFHQPYLPLMFDVLRMPSPTFQPPAEKGHGGAKRLTPQESADFALGLLHKTLQKSGHSIAAVCIEPIVQGAAGIVVHPGGFLREVRAIASEFDVLLIADEVATGFGRTGTMFACEHEQVRPDLMCVGKGITGGYLPLAATFATQQVFDAFLGEPWEGRTFFHGHTYTGNPLACAAALASLDLFERNHLVDAVAEKSVRLAEMLRPLNDLPHVGEVRQKGFMVGIELVQDKASRIPFDPRRRIGAAVCERVRRRGVILRPLGDVIVLMPPLAMGLEHLSQIVEAVRAEVAPLAGGATGSTLD